MVSEFFSHSMDVTAAMQWPSEIWKWKFPLCSKQYSPCICSLMLSDTAAFSLNISQQIHCIVATHKSTGSHLGQVNLFDVFLLPPTMLSDLHTIHTHFHTRTHTHHWYRCSPECICGHKYCCAYTHACTCLEHFGKWIHKLPRWCGWLISMHTNLHAVLHIHTYTQILWLMRLSPPPFWITHT